MRLHWPKSGCASCCQLVNRALGGLTVGIDNDNNFWRVQSEMLYSKVQCVSFAEFCMIIADNDFRTGMLPHGSRIVSAVIGNDKKSIAREQLRLYIFERRSKAGAFIVGWDKIAIRFRTPFLEGRVIACLEEKGRGDSTKNTKTGMASRQANRVKTYEKNNAMAFLLGRQSIRSSTTQTG